MDADAVCRVLGRLAKDKDEDVRRGVAWNKNIPEQCACDLLRQLARDKDVGVRWGVADNPLFKKCKEVK